MAAKKVFSAECSVCKEVKSMRTPTIPKVIIVTLCIAVQYSPQNAESPLESFMSVWHVIPIPSPYVDALSESCMDECVGDDPAAFDQLRRAPQPQRLPASRVSKARDTVGRIAGRSLAECAAMSCVFSVCFRHSNMSSLFIPTHSAVNEI